MELLMILAEYWWVVVIVFCLIGLRFSGHGNVYWREKYRD